MSWILASTFLCPEQCDQTCHSPVAMLMWDSPLCAVNMFYYHWLTEKLLWPMAGQNVARRENEGEYREKEGRVRQAPKKQNVR